MACQSGSQAGLVRGFERFLTNTDQRIGALNHAQSGDRVEQLLDTRESAFLKGFLGKVLFELLRAQLVHLLVWSISLFSAVLTSAGLNSKRDRLVVQRSNSTAETWGTFLQLARSTACGI